VYLFVVVVVVVDVDSDDNRYLYTTVADNVKSKIKDQRIAIQICVMRARVRVATRFDGEWYRSILALR
jgi:hypothetical protein